MTSVDIFAWNRGPSIYQLNFIKTFVFSSMCFANCSLLFSGLWNCERTHMICSWLGLLSCFCHCCNRSCCSLELFECSVRRVIFGICQLGLGLSIGRCYDSSLVTWKTHLPLQDSSIELTNCPVSIAIGVNQAYVRCLMNTFLNYSTEQPDIVMMPVIPAFESRRQD